MDPAPNVTRSRTQGGRPSSLLRLGLSTAAALFLSARLPFFMCAEAGCCAWTYNALKSIGLVRSSVRRTGGSGYFNPVAQLNSIARSSLRTRPSARACLYAA